MTKELEIWGAEVFFKNQIDWYFPLRHDPGCRIHLRICMRALRQLRTSGPWW